MTNIGIYKESYICARRDTGIARLVDIRDRRKEEEKDLYTLLTMDHPNINKFYEIYGDSKRLYLVTEFLTGGDLFDHTTEVEHFTEHDAALIMKQVLSAVAHCHSKDIVHRNIKPQNLIFEAKRESAMIKLVDFTFAGLFREKRISEVSMGTIYYMAPEVLQGLYNEKCDV